MYRIWAYLSIYSRFWHFTWKLGSCSGSASKWKVGSGSASKWQAGPGSASKWQAGSGSASGSISMWCGFATLNKACSILAYAHHTHVLCKHMIATCILKYKHMLALRCNLILTNAPPTSTNSASLYLHFPPHLLPPISSPPHLHLHTSFCQKQRQS